MQHGLIPSSYWCGASVNAYRSPFNRWSHHVLGHRHLLCLCIDAARRSPLEVGLDPFLPPDRGLSDFDHWLYGHKSIEELRHSELKSNLRPFDRLCHTRRMECPLVFQCFRPAFAPPVYLFILTSARLLIVKGLRLNAFTLDHLDWPWLRGSLSLSPHETLETYAVSLGSARQLRVPRSFVS